MKKYVFQKPPYPVDFICEKIKKWFLPEKAVWKLTQNFISRTIFYDMILSDFEKVGISKNM